MNNSYIVFQPQAPAPTSETQPDFSTAFAWAPRVDEDDKDVGALAAALSLDSSLVTHSSPSCAASMTD